VLTTLCSTAGFVIFEFVVVGRFLEKVVFLLCTVCGASRL
jgi:hypothetical protein